MADAQFLGSLLELRSAAVVENPRGVRVADAGRGFRCRHDQFEWLVVGGDEDVDGQARGCRRRLGAVVEAPDGETEQQ